MLLWPDIDPAEITAFSREAAEALDTGFLSQVLPNVYQGEVKFSWNVNEVLSDLATFGEFDTESTVGREGEGEEKTMRLLPVSRKLKLSEWEQVTDLDRVRALAEEKADKVVRAVLNRLNQARSEALVDGALAINENKIKLSPNFDRPANQTRVTPGTLWTATGADPVANIRAWVDLVSDKSGVVPDVMSMSTRLYSAFAAALSSGGYVTTGTGVVSRAAVGEIMASYGLPQPTIDDTRVAGQRLIPDNVLILAPSGGVAGGTVYGPTVESRDPRYNLGGREPGIVAGVYSTDDPPVKWVMAKAAAMPVLANPATTFSATPIAAA